MTGTLQIISESHRPTEFITTGNPELSFFKSVYRKHTNFSIEHRKITWVTEPSDDYTKHTVKISRDGDLIKNIWISSYFPAVANTNTNPSPTFTSWCNNTGHAYIKEYSLLIGGQTIDKQNSMFLDVYNEYTDIDNKENIGLNKHTNNLYMTSGSSNIAPELQLCIPLKFFHSKDYNFAFPLISLQYHEIELEFIFRKLKNLLISDTKFSENDIIESAPNGPETELWGEYIFLDNDERTRISQKSHEILIEQTQILFEGEYNKSNELHFNHPVKQLIWVVSYSNRTNEIDVTKNIANPYIFKHKKYNDDGTFSNGVETIGGNDYFNYQVHATNNYNIKKKESGSCVYLNNTLEHFDTCNIKLNGMNRTNDHKAYFYKYIQPLTHNIKIPSKTIYTYSFAINPNDYQPSGFCNFSSFETKHLEFNKISDLSNEAKLYVFAISYNILKITNGMGGLAYAN